MKLFFIVRQAFCFLFCSLLFRLPKFYLVTFNVKNMNKFAVFRILNFVYNCYSFIFKLLYKSF